MQKPKIIGLLPLIVLAPIWLPLALAIFVAAFSWGVAWQVANALAEYFDDAL